jgi:RNA polymerase sigma factor (sigma-70 family)
MGNPTGLSPTAFEASEEAIAARMLQGDPEAFSWLYERYFPRLYDLACRMLGDPDEAMDVAQETFLKFLEGRPRQPPRHFRAYLYAIARREIYDVLRRSRRHVRWAEGEQEEAEEAEPRAPDEGAEREILQRERMAFLREALQALPEEEAMLLDLHLRHGLTPAELAVVFGRSSGAIHTRLSRARDHLEEAMAAWILLRVGRRACPTLTAITGGPEEPPPALTPDLRRALRRHLEGCAACQETRRRYLSAAEWLGGITMLSPSPEGARRARERLSQAAQALTAGGVAVGAAGAAGIGGLKGLGAVLLTGAVMLGLAAAALGLRITGSGSAEVRVENRNCPPLASPSPAVRLLRILPNVEVPVRIETGATEIIRLPPATLTLQRREDGIRAAAYGMAFDLPIEGLTAAEWDGADLPPGPYAITLRPGERHTLRVRCR